MIIETGATRLVAPEAGSSGFAGFLISFLKSGHLGTCLDRLRAQNERLLRERSRGANVQIGMPTKSQYWSESPWPAFFPCSEIIEHRNDERSESKHARRRQNAVSAGDCGSRNKYCRQFCFSSIRKSYLPLPPSYPEGLNAEKAIKINGMPSAFDLELWKDLPSSISIRFSGQRDAPNG